MLKKILVGLDGSKGSFKALREGILLAVLAGTELHTISVEEVPRFPGTIGEVTAAEEGSGRYHIRGRYRSSAKDRWRARRNFATSCSDRYTRLNPSSSSSRRENTTSWS